MESTQAFADLLKDSRRARKLSQLELAMRADVSQRHVSFLESGRSQPSRDMVLNLAEVLDLPLRDRNRWLNSAGFRGLYPQRTLQAEHMRPAREALALLIRHHMPYPAIVVDRCWNILMQNDAMPAVFGALEDIEQRWLAVCGDGPPNALKMTLHPDGLAPFIANFDQVAPVILARTAHEALTSPELQALLDEVLSYPNLPRRLRSIDLEHSQLPVLPTHFQLGDIELKMFSMITTFGTPLDVTTDELRVESFFPVDEISERWLRTLSQGHDTERHER